MPTNSKKKTPAERKPKPAEASLNERAAPEHNSVWQSLALQSGIIQPKLTVSSPDDPYEQEADRIADRVTGATGPQLQRACACGGGCKECGVGHTDEESMRVQTRRIATGDAAAATAPSVVHEVLRSPGRPLDSDTRSFMESRLGHDFAGVRVHSDAQAAESARAVNSLAYTVGSDVVLGAGQHAPGTAAGRRLLAHELTHVMQQSSGLGRNVLQRWSIEKCTFSQTVYVEDSFAKSFDDLSKVARLINQKPTTERVKNAMWLAFRDDSEATVEIVRANINLLKAKITGTRVTCQASSHPSCGTDTGYHSRGKDDYGEIYLCMPAFSNLGAVEQANTLTHEASHKYLNLRDTGYFTQGCEETPRHKPTGDEGDKDSGTAGDNPAERLNNADAYACFVHFLVRLRSEGLAAKAGEFRGDKLGLEAQEPFVYTKTGTPKRATFRLTGAPANSGFRFKWKLVAGEEAFSLASLRNEKTNTGDFDEDTLEVYVPSVVRSLLAQKKISKVSVRCVIQLYRPRDGKEAPPEITRTVEVSVHEGQDPFDPSI